MQAHRARPARLPPLFKRFVTFSGGSLVGAAIDYTLTLGLHDLAGLDPTLALALVMCVSATVVFYYHERITFRTQTSGRLSRYVRFIALSVLVLALRVVVLHGLVRAGLPVFIAVAIAIVLVSIVNFAASSMLVFLKGSECTPPASPSSSPSITKRRTSRPSSNG